MEKENDFNEEQTSKICIVKPMNVRMNGFECVWFFAKKKKNLRYLTIFNIDVFSIILRLQRIIELLHGIFCKLKINVFYKIFYQIF